MNEDEAESEKEREESKVVYKSASSPVYWRMERQLHSDANMLQMDYKSSSYVASAGKRDRGKEANSIKVV